MITEHGMEGCLCFCAVFMRIHPLVAAAESRDAPGRDFRCGARGVAGRLGCTSGSVSGCAWAQPQTHRSTALPRRPREKPGVREGFGVSPSVSLLFLSLCVRGLWAAAHSEVNLLPKSPTVNVPVLFAV